LSKMANIHPSHDVIDLTMDDSSDEGVPVEAVSPNSAPQGNARPTNNNSPPWPLSIILDEQHLEADVPDPPPPPSRATHRDLASSDLRPWPLSDIDDPDEIMDIHVEADSLHANPLENTRAGVGEEVDTKSWQSQAESSGAGDGCGIAVAKTNVAEGQVGAAVEDIVTSQPLPSCDVPASGTAVKRKASESPLLAPSQVFTPSSAPLLSPSDTLPSSAQSDHLGHLVTAPASDENEIIVLSSTDDEVSDRPEVPSRRPGAPRRGRSRARNASATPRKKARISEVDTPTNTANASGVASWMSAGSIFRNGLADGDLQARLDVGRETPSIAGHGPSAEPVPDSAKRSFSVDQSVLCSDIPERSTMQSNSYDVRPSSAPTMESLPAQPGVPESFLTQQNTPLPPSSLVHPPSPVTVAAPAYLPAPVAVPPPPPHDRITAGSAAALVHAITFTSNSGVGSNLGQSPVVVSGTASANRTPVDNQSELPSDPALSSSVTTIAVEDTLVRDSSFSAELIIVSSDDEEVPVAATSGPRSTRSHTRAHQMSRLVGVTNATTETEDAAPRHVTAPRPTPILSSTSPSFGTTATSSPKVNPDSIPATTTPRPFISPRSTSLRQLFPSPSFTSALESSIAQQNVVAGALGSAIAAPTTSVSAWETHADPMQTLKSLFKQRGAPSILNDGTGEAPKSWSSCTACVVPIGEVCPVHSVASLPSSSPFQQQLSQQAVAPEPSATSPSSGPPRPLPTEASIQTLPSSCTSLPFASRDHDLAQIAPHRDPDLAAEYIILSSDSESDAATPPLRTSPRFARVSAPASATPAVHSAPKLDGIGDDGGIAQPPSLSSSNVSQVSTSLPNTAPPSPLARGGRARRSRGGGASGGLSHVDAPAIPVLSPRSTRGGRARRGRVRGRSGNVPKSLTSDKGRGAADDESVKPNVDDDVILYIESDFEPEADQNEKSHQQQQTSTRASTPVVPPGVVFAWPLPPAPPKSPKSQSQLDISAPQSRSPSAISVSVSSDLGDDATGRLEDKRQGSSYWETQSLIAKLASAINSSSAVKRALVSIVRTNPDLHGAPMEESEEEEGMSLNSGVGNSSRSLVRDDGNLFWEENEKATKNFIITESEYDEERVTALHDDKTRGAVQLPSSPESSPDPLTAPQSEPQSGRGRGHRGGRGQVGRIRGRGGRLRGPRGRRSSVAHHRSVTRPREDRPIVIDSSDEEHIKQERQGPELGKQLGTILDIKGKGPANVRGNGSANKDKFLALGTSITIHPPPWVLSLHSTLPSSDDEHWLPEPTDLIRKEWLIEKFMDEEASMNNLTEITDEDGDIVVKSSPRMRLKRKRKNRGETKEGTGIGASSTRRFKDQVYTQFSNYPKHSGTLVRRSSPGPPADAGKMSFWKQIRWRETKAHVGWRGAVGSRTPEPTKLLGVSELAIDGGRTVLEPFTVSTHFGISEYKSTKPNASPPFIPDGRIRVFANGAARDAFNQGIARTLVQVDLQDLIARTVSETVVVKAPQGPNILVSGGYDRAVRCWDAEHGSPIGSYRHAGWVSTIVAGLDQQGDLLVVSADRDASLVMARLQTSVGINFVTASPPRFRRKAIDSDDQGAGPATMELGHGPAQNVVFVTYGFQDDIKSAMARCYDLETLSYTSFPELGHTSAASSALSASGSMLALGTCEPTINGVERPNQEKNVRIYDVRRPRSAIP
ncbi:hypothetical protein HDU93_007827, partial [Gonapodya sp. JEL0774]